MSENILINANDNEALRVALIQNEVLHDLDVEFKSEIKRKANIYKARLTTIQPSLNSAFLDFGANRQGFLPLKEISEEYFIKKNETENNEKPSIKDLLKEGQELIVQVEKDERGTKGAALTTFITLAGCYLVLMPNNPSAGGISRRIDGDDRNNLKDLLEKLEIPKGMGVIVRTAGIGRSLEDLQWDLDILKMQWESIKAAANQKSAPFLIHQEGDIIIRSIRDNLRKDINEILIDEQSAFVKAKHYLQQIKPELLSKLKFYQDSIPLFVRYQIEHQIETAYLREVSLQSGGSIVIDRTEALVSIDINSAKSTGGQDIEDTALNTNLEAANEIARQLRLRDLGGLIVIDFIDMHQQKNHRAVEQCLKEALHEDRARIQIGRISRFGLLEMSRQRLRLSLGETIQQTCETCSGRGILRSIFSLSNSVIRLIEEESVKNHTAEVHAHLPVDVATFIINEKRSQILNIEKRYGIKVVIIPNQWKQFPEYDIERIENNGNKNKMKLGKYSFELMALPESKLIPPEEIIETVNDSPAIKDPIIIPFSQQEKNVEEHAGILKKLWNNLFSSSTIEEKTKDVPEEKNANQGNRRYHNKKRYHNNNRRNNNNNNRRNQNNRPHSKKNNNRSSQEA